MPPRVIAAGEAAMDSFFTAAGQAYGSAAKKLLAANMDPNALRTNATLRKDEWKRLDERVTPIAVQRMVGADDLISRGLVYPIPNGLGTTVLETENQSDMEDATMNMSGVQRGENDALEFDLGYLPLPITHKGFQINIRKLYASRQRGEPLDTSQGEIAARKVSEKVETTLFVGASTYAFGGGTIYGYLDYPYRNQVTLTEHWDDSGADPLADLISMKQASITDRHYGPWGLYIPTAWETTLDDNYTTNYQGSMRKRLLEVDGISFIKTADKLTADNCVLVNLQPETVRMVVGMQPQTVEWETEGGMVFHFKVMTIMVPQIRADQDNRCGLIHGSK